MPLPEYAEDTACQPVRNWRADVASTMASWLSTVMTIGEAMYLARVSVFDAWMIAARLSLSLLSR